VVPASEYQALQHQVRELQRLGSADACLPHPSVEGLQDGARVVALIGDQFARFVGVGAALICARFVSAAVIAPSIVVVSPSSAGCSATAMMTPVSRSTAWSGKQPGFSRWRGDDKARVAVYANRTRLGSGIGKQAMRWRAEIVERPFAHNLD
jgi:hypothetical protein